MIKVLTYASLYYRVVPCGATNVYSMPVDISLWGKPENQTEAVDKLKKYGVYLFGGTQPVTNPGSDVPSGSLGASEFALSAIQPRQTYLTPAEVYIFHTNSCLIHIFVTFVFFFMYQLIVCYIWVMDGPSHFGVTRV